MYTKSERFHCFSGTCLLNAQLTACFPAQSQGWRSKGLSLFLELWGDISRSLPKTETTVCSTCLQAELFLIPPTQTHPQQIPCGKKKWQQLYAFWTFQFCSLPTECIVGARRSKFLDYLPLNAVLWLNNNRRLLLRQKYLMGSFVNCASSISTQTLSNKPEIPENSLYKIKSLLKQHFHT